MKLNRINAVAVLCGLALAAPTFAADAGGGFKVGGFVDGRFTWNNVTPASYNVFNIADGALKVMHDMGGSSFMIDIPFFTGTPASNAFTIGTVKAQAYVQHKYDGGIWWKLGQFDSMLGVDANDTEDFFFTGINRMDANIDLFTHTGLAAGYMGGSWGFNVLVANLRNTGINAAQNALDLLGQLTIGSGSMTGKVGFLFNFQGATNGHILDASIGLKAGELDVDAGFMMKLGMATTDWGFVVAPVYSASDKLALGARFAMTNLAAVSGFDITVGPRYSFSKNLDARLNYNLTSSGATSTHTVAASGVYHL